MLLPLPVPLRVMRISLHQCCCSLSKRCFRDEERLRNTSHVCILMPIAEKVLFFSAPILPMMLHFDSYCISVEIHKGLSFISSVSDSLSFARIHLLNQTPYRKHYRNNPCKIFLFPSASSVYLFQFLIIKCRRQPNTEYVLMSGYC